MARPKKEQLHLVNASDASLFWVADGKALRNLRDLAWALKEMNDATFSCHANKEKNDFANWVAEVLQDEALAKLLRGSKTKATALKKIEERLKEYQD
ncbi:MAG: hypothetical protein A3J67_00085 [Parcubacteria group bacterium RIFCSPHIGHO2_02_FULL_48_10b]|nr:MAG: hypothetical protein A3J67_00085 [Parcubacteria group bacterium RIFCSPHIGHO2_02_FULL_48_10b]